MSEQYTSRLDGACPMTGLGSTYRPFEHDGMYAFFARARSEEPIFYNEELDSWVVTRRDEALEVFRDPETYSASNSQTPIFPFPPEVTQLLSEGGYRRQPTQANLDEPDHGRIRRVAGKFLNAKRFRQLEPQIRELVRQHVEQMAGLNEVDIVDALTYELPARVIFLLLGTPDVDARQVKAWSDNRFTMVWGRIPEDDAVRAGHQLLDYWNYCKAIVHDRMEHPGDDYASELLKIRDGDDDVISVNEIINLVFGILLAGHETTSNAIANLVLEVLQTDQWDRLVHAPELIKSAVEEGLRFAPPFITWRRRTTRAVSLGGVALPQDATILIAMASANRDEAHFPGGETFDVGRDDSAQHLSFGNGIHFCMGAALARLEMKVALEELVAAFPKMTLVPGQEFEWTPTVSFRGPAKVRVRPYGAPEAGPHVA